jgi:hypothetical protein
MSRKNKIRIVIYFFVSFLAMLLLLVLPAHYEGLRGECIPLSWQEICNDYLLFDIIFSFGFAILMSIRLNNEKKDCKKE